MNKIVKTERDLTALLDELLNEKKDSCQAIILLNAPKQITGMINSLALPYPCFYLTNEKKRQYRYGIYRGIRVLFHHQKSLKEI